MYILRLSDQQVSHSFPTRRSSDLDVALPGHELTDLGLIHVEAEDAVAGRGETLRERQADVAESFAAAGYRVLGFRSEEHTSELQSRFDLVCRLLLEKKKKHISSNQEAMKRRFAVTDRVRHAKAVREHRLDPLARYQDASVRWRGALRGPGAG